MGKQKKVSQSEIDGVQYRHAKLWQVIFSQLSCGTIMAFSFLIGLVSYLANSGYGIAVAAVGGILTASRVFDGVVDPFIALFIDKISTRFGKLRIFMTIGFIIRAFAIYLLYIWGSGKFSGTIGVVFFISLYLLYIFGNSIGDIANNMIAPVISNDPKQRPIIAFWSILFSTIFTIFFSLYSVIMILPKFNNQYSNEMLATSCITYTVFALVLHVLSLIGVTSFDKPEYFEGTSEDNIRIKDMFRFYKDNRPFQLYVIAALADKISQQAASQAILATMMFGILLGNMQFGTIVSIGVNIPAVFLSIIGARYAGKHGSKKAVITWSWFGIVFGVFGIIFLALVDTRKILSTPILLILYLLIQFCMNFGRMCNSAAGGAMRADIIDYELDRSGKYLSAVVTATYNFLNQLVSSLGILITTSLVALIGYKTVMPQPTDEPTRGILMVIMFISYGLPILGWMVTVIALKFYTLTKEEMVEVQKRISIKKKEMQTLKEA